MSVAAVTGLAAEAVIARRAGLRAAATGGDGARTSAAIARLRRRGRERARQLRHLRRPRSRARLGQPAAAAGGARTWPAGVLPSIPRGIGRWRRRWRGPASMRRPAIWSGPMPSSPRPSKSGRSMLLGAVAADLESHVVARAALAAGLPFLVLRAVADPAQRRRAAGSAAGARFRGTCQARRGTPLDCYAPSSIPLFVANRPRNRRCAPQLAPRRAGARPHRGRGPPGPLAKSKGVRSKSMRRV